MARLKFPEDRSVYVYGDPGNPLLLPGEIPMSIFLDQAATTLADITTLAGDPLPGSVINIGFDGLIPEFLGPPDGSHSVWVKPLPGGGTYWLGASLTSRMDALAASKGAEMIIPFTIPTNPWIVTHGLTYRPVVRVFDETDHQLLSDVSFSSTQVIVNHGRLTTGTVRIR